MDPFTIFAAITAITGAASAVSSSNAAKSQRRAQRAQRDQQNMRAAMERRQSIRETRKAFAIAQQRGENQGVGDSSGAQGGAGSILSQGNRNLSFLDGQQANANIAGRWMDKASSQEAAAGMWKSLSNLASTGMGMSAKPEWVDAMLGFKNAPDVKLPPIGSGPNSFTTKWNNYANQRIAMNMTGKPL